MEDSGSRVNDPGDSPLGVFEVVVVVSKDGGLAAGFSLDADEPTVRGRLGSTKLLMNLLGLHRYWLGVVDIAAVGMISVVGGSGGGLRWRGLVPADLARISIIPELDAWNGRGKPLNIWWVDIQVSRRRELRRTFLNIACNPPNSAAVSETLRDISVTPLLIIILCEIALEIKESGHQSLPVPYHAISCRLFVQQQFLVKIK